MLDPSPRKYPPAVSLIRRSSRGAASGLAAKSYADIELWLLEQALAETDLLLLFESFAWRLVAAGLSLDRASLHVGTLHPELIEFAWHWNSADRLCDEVKVAPAVLQSDMYRRNPLFAVIEHGERFRGDTRDAQMRERFPLIAELAASGITDYIAEALTTGGGYHNAVTLATKSPEGFTANERRSIKRVLQLLGLHVERHIVQRIARNVLNTSL
jgi:adenylate cyclase